MAKPLFPKVKEARQVLKDRAVEILETYLQVCRDARDAGDYETAAKSLQWLIEHMPNDGGETVIDPSAAKPKVNDKALPTGPAIQIGIALGGVGQRQALPPVEVIDVTNDTESN